MKIHNIITEKLRDIEEHVKGGLDSYYQLTKAKRLAADDGHDYDKLPEYDRGADQPHKEKYLALAAEVSESDLEEVSNFKKRELEYELRHEEPKKGSKKPRPNKAKSMGARRTFGGPSEEVEEAKAPKMKGVSIKGSEVTGLRAKDGKLYSAKPLISSGKLSYRVEDEFGAFDTIDLKTFAKRFG